MYPTLFGQYDTIFVTWGVASLCGMVLAFVLSSRDGHSPERAYLGIVLLAFTFLAGTKIHFWLANRDLVRQAGGVTPLLLYGFHFPGGLLLSVILGPLLLRAVGLRPLQFLDSIAPAVGFSIALARLGCFANGCCFGYISGAPWAMTFPSGSRAYAHHLEEGLIAASAATSQPVLPLNLWFAATGLLIGVVLWRWRPRRRFVGQLGLGLITLWAVGNVCIEYWRDPTMVPGTPHLWGISVGIAAVSLPTLLILSWVYRDQRVPLE